MNFNIPDLIRTIKRIKEANILPNYIKYIQFPFFRNIELDQKINFDFPLTAFIGSNGSGKSSTLHALYGCPEGKTPYDFWFSSEVDPVEYQLENRGLRHSFFYGFNDGNNIELQVVKARIRRAGNPNYWETSRPILSYGMNKPPYDRERNEPINKNVVYFDFRSELSAFDKYFYFEIPPSYLVNNKKQEFIRYKSKMLRNLFNEEYEIANDSVGKPLNESIVVLNNDELSVISYILGRNYSQIKILKHRLFHNWGFSIKLRNDFHEYSEAFAGSGETATVRLVHELLNSVEGSLVLLDEPEVSLHPAAQKRLKIFLLNQIILHKHQIIIATHSPNLIEELPKEAIKIFAQKIDNGKFIIKENILPEEAFYFIGQQINDKINLIVEDKLAKKIIERVLEKIGPEVNNRFVTQLIPGGAETIMKNYIPVHCNTNNYKYFFVFDGDKKRVENLFDILTLSEQDKTEDFLRNKIMEQTGCNIKFYVDGNTEGGNSTQRIKLMMEFLKYFRTQVKFLPNATPEDIIWSDEILGQKLNQQDFESNHVRIISLANNKHKIFETSKLLFGVATQYEAFEDILVTEWLQKEDALYKNIFEMIKDIESNF